MDADLFSVLIDHTYADDTNSSDETTCYTNCQEGQECEDHVTEGRQTAREDNRDDGDNSCESDKTDRDAVDDEGGALDCMQGVKALIDLVWPVEV